jgi:site-specific recombinase XerD
VKKSWIHNGTILIRVGTHHLAFLRGYLEGLDLGAMAERYLETAIAPDPDLRVAKSTLKWIREQLMVVARRSGRFPDARLIMINPDRLRAVHQRHLPTLEQFREDRDPYEMYPESELIKLFEEEFGGARGGKIDRRIERNDRLRRKQIGALFTFEKLIGADPALSDPVGGWLDPALATRLGAAGIETLGDLVTTINNKGYRWWGTIPRFGEKAAAQVVAWLKTEPVEQALGVKLGPQATQRERQLSVAILEQNREKKTGIVPFEYLLVPADLDGSNGENRGMRCKIDARNDYEAVQEWLRLKPAESNTWRSYRKEVERFLLWCIVERKRPLSSLTSADCVAYRDFLWHLDPAKGDLWPFALPRTAWFGKRGERRWSELWRPFEGPLSEESQKVAITIVDSMCRWLTNRRYLDSNPWEGVPSRLVVDQKVDATRSFTKFQWGYLIDFLERMEETPKYVRLRFVLILGYATGLRLSEMVRAKVGDLERVRDVEAEVSNKWVLNVIGKGRRARQVPFPSLVLSELDNYLKHRGLGDRFSCDPNTRLIGKLAVQADRTASSIIIADGVELLPSAETMKPGAEVEDNGSVSEELLYKMLKKFFADAAESVNQAAKQLQDLEDAANYERIASFLEMAKHIRRGSTHWLRHTCGTHAVANGVKLETIQSNFGHASIDTTTIYVEPDTKQRVEEMENFLLSSFKRIQ